MSVISERTGESGPDLVYPLWARTVPHQFCYLGMSDDMLTSCSWLKNLCLIWTLNMDGLLTDFAQLRSRCLWTSQIAGKKIGMFSSHNLLTNICPLPNHSDILLDATNWCDLVRWIVCFGRWLFHRVAVEPVNCVSAVAVPHRRDRLYIWEATWTSGSIYWNWKYWAEWSLYFYNQLNA